jgi:hypothetical protein
MSLFAVDHKKKLKLSRGRVQALARREASQKVPDGFHVTTFLIYNHSVLQDLQF